MSHGIFVLHGWYRWSIVGVDDRMIATGFSHTFNLAVRDAVTIATDRGVVPNGATNNVQIHGPQRGHWHVDRMAGDIVTRPI